MEKHEEKEVRGTSQNLYIAGGNRFRLEGGGRSITSAEIEERLLKWIHERRGRGVWVS